ncbi:MAG: NAD(P)-dependent oxidoreductase [Acidimicrobiales bacterium]
MVTVAVEPPTRPAMHAAFVAAVRDAGATVGPLDEAEGLIWADPQQAGLYPGLIAAAPRVRWIQLPYAGIEPFVDYLDARFLWTCGKGVYAPPVAEHALALALAGLRGVTTYARADRWSAPIGRNLLGARVLILGGGGICASLIELLAPFGCAITVFRHHDAPIERARVITERRQLDAALPEADVVVIALALTDRTRGIVDSTFLSRMAEHAWLVNVGRGGHVITDDLVLALREQRIGGAALDVTDPEPLPPGHPLWSLANCVVTPHIANTPEMGLPLIAARVRENTARFLAGEPLIGVVDVALGY